MSQKIQLFLAILGLSCLASVVARASGVTDPLDRPAVLVRSPERCVMLAITEAGSRLVAVGERGIVVLSDDGGKSWRQAKVPTSVSLTAVQFPSPTEGWAVGHAGIVLHTGDRGETWTRQLDGKIAAEIEFEAAQANSTRVGAANSKHAVANAQVIRAQELVNDGADKPFLDLHFEDNKTGFIVGAFGMMFHTEDGGKTWKSWMDRLDNPKGLHIYAIHAVGRMIYLAGEQGLFLKSADAGRTFARVQTPYQGTYFSIAAVPTGQIVLAGLRGNAYWSNDQGKSFTKSEVPVPVSFAATTTLKGGALLFVNQAGQLFESRDQGRSLHSLAIPPMPPSAAIRQIFDGSLVAVGVGGVFPVSLSNAGSTEGTGGVQ